MRISFSASLSAQATNRALAAQKRREIDARPAGLTGFKRNLIVESVVDESDYEALLAHHVEAKPLPQAVMRRVRAKLREFYAVYEQCFPIAGERESRQGFLALQTQGNFDAKLRAKIGPFREFMEILRDPHTGEAIGGLNFAVYVHPRGVPTVHSTYAFLAPEVRGLGLAARMIRMRDTRALEYVRRIDAKSLARAGGLYTFAEQNIPKLMDARSYATDSAAAIDQVERLRKWSALAYLPLQLAYVQPALEEGGEPCDILSLNTYFRALRSAGSAARPKLGEIVRPKHVAARVVRDHLRAFFLHSVCKDIDADVNDITTRTMLADLDARIARRERIVVTPLKEVKNELDTWETRIRSLQQRLGDKPLSSRHSIQELLTIF